MLVAAVDAAPAKVIRRGRATLGIRDMVKQGRRLRTIAAMHPRPATRGECARMPRPCPFVGCRYHLYLEVNEHGGIKFRHPDLRPWELEESCALDVAERGAQPLERVGDVTGLGKSRVDQVEAIALQKVREACENLGLRPTWLREGDDDDE